MSPRPARHVVVLGLMGAGKSTVGRFLADRLGRPLRDNDEELGRLIGGTAADYADLQGMEALHAAEAEVLRTCLAGAEPAVVTAAASVGDRADLAAMVTGHLVVWLDVAPDVLASRIPSGRHHRPLAADPAEGLRRQRDRRAPAFAAVADLVVDDRADLDQLAGQVARSLDRR